MEDLKEKLEAIREMIDEAIESCDGEEYESEETEESKGNSSKPKSGKKESVGKILKALGNEKY